MKVSFLAVVVAGRVGRQLNNAVCPIAGNTTLRKREKTSLKID